MTTTINEFFYYTSKKRVPCDRIGWVHSSDVEELIIILNAAPTTPIGSKPRTQTFWATLCDDDDWCAHKEFPDFDSALDFYLKAPSIIDWDWVNAHKFTL